MRRGIRVLIVGLIMVLTASIAASAAAGPDLVPGNPVYLALGDSWAYGQGGPGPHDRRLRRWRRLLARHRVRPHEDCDGVQGDPGELIPSTSVEARWGRHWRPHLSKSVHRYANHHPTVVPSEEQRSSSWVH